MMVPSWLQKQTEEMGTGDPIQYLAKNSRSFRFATRFLSAPQAREIAEVYAYCRFTDDLIDMAADKNPKILREKLQEWEGLSYRAYQGEKTGLSVLDIPLGRMGSRGISFEYASELIEGMRMDIEPRHYFAMEDLEDYSFRVAGVVGQWLTELAGINNPWALARAADLGHAMQLTNILRDVGEDYERGRVYLPLNLLEKHGLDIQKIGELKNRTGAMPVEYIQLMKEIIGIAETNYRMAFQAIPSLPEYFQRPVLVAALVYREIHSAIKKNGYDNFHFRAHSSTAVKLGIGVQALWLLPCMRNLFPADHAKSLAKEMAYGQ